MTDYILMRNNKQSGPHSLAELLQFGFKPYDLIWIEGKSAMWRYPSEVPELKEYATAVEEQLYDRVYSKKKTDDQVDQKKPVPDNIPQKKVFISMPDKPSPVFKTETNQPQKQMASVYTVTDDKPAAEIKFSQPLSDIKEMYAKNLRDKKQLITQRLYLFQNLKKVFVYLGLIAIGVFVAYLFNFSKKNAIAVVNRKEIKSKEAIVSAINQPVLKIDDPVITEDIHTVNEASSLNSATHNVALKKANKKLINENQTVLVLGDKETDQKAKNQNISEQASSGVELNQVTGERNKKTRGENDESVSSSAPIENDIISQITVNNNNYEHAAFGGIRNLELTLTNHSKYFLDKVIVELQYLKPNKQPLRSENIFFNAVPSQGTLTIAVSPTNRGIKVAYKITRIESKELGNGTAGL